VAKQNLFSKQARTSPLAIRIWPEAGSTSLRTGGYESAINVRRITGLAGPCGARFVNVSYLPRALNLMRTARLLAQVDTAKGIKFSGGKIATKTELGRPDFTVLNLQVLHTGEGSRRIRKIPFGQVG